MISGLEIQFVQEFQKRAHGYWEERNAIAHDHQHADEFLSVSWQGSIKYLAARHSHRAEVGVAQAQTTSNGTAAVSSADTGRILNQFGFAPPKRGFFRCLFSCVLPDVELRSSVYEEGPYHLDCTIYHKESHLEPDSLRRLFGYGPNGPSSPVGVVPGFAEVPLNHFYLVRREGPVRMITPPPNVQTKGVLEISDVHFRNAVDLVEFLADQIFPEDIVKPVSDWWCVKICSILRILLVVAVMYGGGHLTYQRFEPFRGLVDYIVKNYNPFSVIELRRELGERTAELEALRLEYEDTVAERDDLLDALEVETTPEGLAEIDRLNAEIERLEAQMAEVIIAGDGGLDLPPCWPSVTANRHAPVYLYDVLADREGLRVMASEEALARAEAESWPVNRLPRDEVITIDQFARGAAPTYALSEARSCRHFVTLREGEHDSAAQYQAQRDMVERYFYIYRP